MLADIFGGPGGADLGFAPTAGAAVVDPFQWRKRTVALCSTAFPQTRSDALKRNLIGVDLDVGGRAQAIEDQIAGLKACIQQADISLQLILAAGAAALRG